MPRLARLDTPGVLNHVIIRGIERRKIFRDNKDKDNFLDRLGTLLPDTIRKGVIHLRASQENEKIMADVLCGLMQAILLWLAII